MPRAVLPEPISHQLAGATLTPVPTGLSSASVSEVVWPDGGRGFLKVEEHDGPGEGVSLLRDERDRLLWLHGRLPVPDVLAWHEADDGGRAHLLTRAVDGEPAHSPVHRGDVEQLIRALAAGLRRVHAVDASACPFSADLEDRIALARRRVDAGLVDPADFGPAYQRFTPEQLLTRLVEARPAPPPATDVVLLHGDYCLPNVLIDRGAVVGYVDLGRAGVGDRYLDLAIAARSLVLNLGAEVLGPFFDAYGLDLPSLTRIDFFVLLDEFF